MIPMKYRKLVVVLAAAALAVSLGACKKKDAGPAGGPGGRARIQFPVDVEQVRVQSLVYSVTAVGSVEAFEKVQVTARVSGAVDRVRFSEGEFAAAGQVLVEIETERYRLAVESAQASFEKAEASKADAEAGLKRRETVTTQNPGLIPGEEVETWRTKVLTAASEVAEKRSALNQAKLNLSDAFVKAPIPGIIQTRTVQTGQFVQAGTVLATLVRRDPLLLRFRVPERDAARIKPGRRRPSASVRTAASSRPRSSTWPSRPTTPRAWWTSRPISTTRATGPSGRVPSPRSRCPSPRPAKPPSFRSPRSARANAASWPMSSKATRPVERILTCGHEVGRRPRSEVPLPV